jgi:hypothetical protein
MDVSDRRRHQRKYLANALECELKKQSHQEEQIDCVAANISQSGICLITTSPLQDGQEVTMKNHIFPSPRTATVRWTEKYQSLYYKAGLEFAS